MGPTTAPGQMPPPSSSQPGNYAGINTDGLRQAGMGEEATGYAEVRGASGRRGWSFTHVLSFGHEGGLAMKE